MLVWTIRFLLLCVCLAIVLIASCGTLTAEEPEPPILWSSTATIQQPRIQIMARHDPNGERTDWISFEVILTDKGDPIKCDLGEFASAAIAMLPHRIKDGSGDKVWPPDFVVDKFIDQLNDCAWMADEFKGEP